LPCDSSEAVFVLDADGRLHAELRRQHHSSSDEGCSIDNVKDWFARTQMLIQECIDPIDVVLEACKPKPLPLYMMM
jgi:hypothetical protein